MREGLRGRRLGLGDRLIWGCECKRMGRRGWSIAGISRFPVVDWRCFQDRAVGVEVAKDSQRRES